MSAERDYFVATTGPAFEAGQFVCRLSVSTLETVEGLVVPRELVSMTGLCRATTLPGAETTRSGLIVPSGPL